MKFSSRNTLRHLLNYYLPRKGNTFILSVPDVYAAEGHRKKSTVNVQCEKEL